MLNGLDLFSGIGGMSIGLREWVRPIAYCEIDPYCQGVLLSRMVEGFLPKSPIATDIRELTGCQFTGNIHIIYGGFPCQDISVAGTGTGLEGERSGLFFEIVRVAKEIKPKFLFLENVPAITCRGGLQVIREVTQMGYDCRWCVISAASIGAKHKRERWFLLGRQRNGEKGTLYSHSNGEQSASIQKGQGNTQEQSKINGLYEADVAHSKSKRCDSIRNEIGNQERQSKLSVPYLGKDWWEKNEPALAGMVDGIPRRMDRTRALGNAVVPMQSKKAFKMLMGIE